MTFSLVLGGSVAGAKHNAAVAPAAIVEVAGESVPPRSPVRHSDPSAIAIPVLGITPAQLRDTWGEARSGSRTHQAIDILSARGTPVVAAVDGTILKLYQSGAGGTAIYLSDMDADIVYYYAHLDRYADGLAEGDLVDRGQILGYVGTTGNAPPNTPHLHFSIERLPPTGEWWKGEPINPYPVLTANGFTVE